MTEEETKIKMNELQLQIQDLKLELRITIRSLSLSIVTSNLLSGWIPDEEINPICNKRVMRAIHLARQIVDDTETTAVSIELR